MGKINTKYHTALEQATEKRGQAARSRCSNPSNPMYPRYGGRGIEFRFASVEEYVRYVISLEGACLEKEIDRIDNDGHYEKGNLRWIDRAAQNRNKESSIRVTYEGKEMVFKDFVENYTDLGLSTASRHFKEGRSLDDLRRLIPLRTSGRKSLRSIKCEKGEPLRGVYSDPLYI
jgi:hypothetical protein